MKNSSERERDTPFGQTMHALRTALGLTQRGLAEHLGVSQQTVEKREAGLRYPKVASLKQIIVQGVQRQIFPAGSRHNISDLKCIDDQCKIETHMSRQYPSSFASSQTRENAHGRPQHQHGSFFRVVH